MRYGGAGALSIQRPPRYCFADEDDLPMLTALISQQQKRPPR